MDVALYVAVCIAHVQDKQILLMLNCIGRWRSVLASEYFEEDAAIRARNYPTSQIM